MDISVRRVTQESFSDYGSAYNLAEGGDGCVVTEGYGWRDVRTRDPLLSQGGHLGMTHGASMPATVTRMERHLHTRESLFCMHDSIVLPVAAATSRTSPRSADVRAFLLQPGDVVVLNEGVWHDACYGLLGPTRYYWHATESDDHPNIWVELDGGPVRIATPR